MIRLLKIEWHKLSAYKTFWILLGIHFVLLTIISIGLESLMGRIQFDGSSGQVMATEMILNQLPVIKFPAVWNNIAYLFSWFSFLLALLVIIIVTNEFKYRTLRQHLIDGLSKWEVIWAKENVIVLISLFSTLVMGILVLLVGKGENPMDGIIALPAYFLYLLLYLNMAFLFAMIIRSSGLAIAALVIYSIVENIISFRLPSYLAEWLPNNLLARFLPNPFGQLMGSEVVSEFSLLTAAPAVLYIASFLGIIYWLLKRGQAAK